IPVGVRWICDAALTFEPEKNTVRIKNGNVLTYDYLVICTGLKLDWGKIAGLVETLGRNGVCGNYSPTHVPYTWDCLQRLQPCSVHSAAAAVQVPWRASEDRLSHCRPSSAPRVTQRMQPGLLRPRPGHFLRSVLCPRMRQDRGTIWHQRPLPAQPCGR